MTDDFLKKTALTREEARFLLSRYLQPLYQDAQRTADNAEMLELLAKLEASALQPETIIMTNVRWERPTTDAERQHRIDWPQAEPAPPFKFVNFPPEPEAVALDKPIRLPVPPEDK